MDTGSDAGDAPVVVEECPPRIDRAMALLRAASQVFDRALMNAAHDAADALRADRPGWVFTAATPDRYSRSRGEWLSTELAEEAMRRAVDELDAHALEAAEHGAGPGVVLLGTHACTVLTRALRDCPGSEAWAEARVRRLIRAAESTA